MMWHIAEDAFRGLRPSNVLKASDMTDFLAMLRRGEPLAFLEPPAGMDKKSFDIQHQQSELKTSLDYLREHCHVGRNHLGT